MKYFGTDGIRGKYNEKITLDLAYKVGCALAAIECDSVVVGIDTRESSLDLAKALSLGIKSTDKKIIYGGVIPTACTMYYSWINNIIGIEITASHNPYTDNGLKVFYNGAKISEELEKAIEDIIDATETVELELPKRLNKTKIVLDAYLEFLTKIMPDETPNMLCDCANGAVGPVLAKLFPKRVLINNSPDGKNINSACGVMHPKTIIEHIKSKEVDIAFAFDGDGDRVYAFDSSGALYDGELITYFLVKHYLKEGLYDSGIVVLTEMANPGLVKAFEGLAIQPLLVKVGDKYVKEALDTTKAKVGGEQAGHVIDTTLLPFGCGIANMLSILSILEKEKLKLSDYFKEVSLWKTRSINLKIINPNVLDDLKVQKKLTKIRNKSSNRIIIRKSGTEPVIRIHVMGENINKVETELRKIYNTLLKKNNGF